MERMIKFTSHFMETGQYLIHKKFGSRKHFFFLIAITPPSSPPQALQKAKEGLPDNPTHAPEYIERIAYMNEIYRAIDQEQ